MRKKKGYNYILARIMTYPICIYSVKTKDMFKHEKKLHSQFKSRRFDMSEGRVVLKTVASVLMIIAFLFYYKEFGIINFQKNLLIILVGCSFLLTFDIKLGVSVDVERRLSEIREDLDSGKTEWFKLNIYQILASMIYLEAVAKPIRLIFLFLTTAFIVFWFFGFGFNG